MLWWILLAVYLTGVGSFTLLGWWYRATEHLLDGEPLSWSLILFTAFGWPIWLITGIYQHRKERSKKDGRSESE